MKHISWCTDGALENWLSAKQHAVSTDTTNRISNNTASEIDWNFLSKNLIQKSDGVWLTKDPSTSLELVANSMRGHPGKEQMMQSISLPNIVEENCGWHYSCNSNLRNEDLKVARCSSSSSSIGLNYGSMTGHEEVVEFSEARHLLATGIESGSGRLYDQSFVFNSPEAGKISGKRLCWGEVTKNANNMRICTSNNIDNQRKSSGARLAEGDYLFSEDLVQKKRFRLLIDREKEIELRAEIYPYCWSLSEIIEMKYRSVGIAVEVKPYHRQDKAKTNEKAFNINFTNSKDISDAFNLGKRKLLFSILEARPSPTNHVRYEVVHPTGVFKGKCFRQQQIHQLRKGDVVTANQLKGNRVRIIKWCPGGGKMNLDLQGWVLVNTKDLDMLRRICWWEAEESVVNKGRMVTSVYPLSQHPKLLRKSERTVQKHMSNKCNPQRVSPANCCPFKVLVEVKVRRGRKEPAIVGRLKPGDIVWANQHKGSMLRIIKPNNPENIVFDSTVKPAVWGWVCLQRRNEGKPRLIRIINSVITKTKSNEKIQFHSQNVRSTRNKPRESRSRLKSDMSTPQSGHFVKGKNTFKSKEDKVLSASSRYHSKTQVTPREQQRARFFSEMHERFEPSTIEMSIPNKMCGMEGQLKPFLKLFIPRSMSYSRSASPMSTSSI